MKRIRLQITNSVSRWLSVPVDAVRIFGSVESRGMSHAGISLRMIAFPPLAQFSPRKFAPRITSLLLVGEATRMGLAPWLSSQNDMDVYGWRVTTKMLTSNRIPIFSLLVVYHLLSELGTSKVFSTTDWISGFFQCAIDKVSIPLTAVCTQDGLWE